MRTTRILIVVIVLAGAGWVVLKQTGWLSGDLPIAAPAVAAPVTAPATGPATRPATRPALMPSDIPGVKNFAKVSDALYRGEQPTRDGFEQLKRLGVKTIVNLRSFHSDRDDIKGLGFQYVHIYCKAWHPEDEDTTKFIKIMQDPKNHPVFVHCQQGADRTGTCVALYRIIEQGWSVEEAVAEMPNFGFHTVWKPIIEYMKKFDSEEFRKTLKTADAAKVEVVP